VRQWLLNAGALYDNGQGGAEDTTAAKTLYAESCKLGHEKACDRFDQI